MSSRAVVLGGGGATGMAWEAGVVAGLREAGVDLAAADVVIGTSAGSFVGAALAAGEGQAYYARFREGEVHEPHVAAAPALWSAWQTAFRDGGGDRAAVGRGFGRVARDFPSPIDESTRRRVIGARLLATAWPARLRVTIQDADSGELAVLDSASGVALVEAVSASGAVPGIWPPVEWDGRTWIDGGMVSGANAFLATGFERVVVLAPMATGYAGIPSAADDVAHLSRTASALLITPDEDSVSAIGPNPYDATRSAAVATAGYAQGLAAAAEVRAAWG